jgi:hypothetical protein
MNACVRRFALSMSLLSVASAAVAAPVGQMSCTSSTQTLTFNISYFDIGVMRTQNSGGSGSGAGAGKVTFQPLVVHTSLAPFQSLFSVASAGTVFENCTLTTKNSTGEQIEFTMKIVQVTEVNAIAQSATREAAATAYTEVDMEYGSVQVTSPASEADDGGASPANDGWVKVSTRPSD